MRTLRGNKGSSIVTILVTMFFVIALGATLLYMSYTGVLLKVAERENVDDFYSAEAVMERIRAGFQQAVTESMATAYVEVLTNSDGDVQQEKFHEEFVRELTIWGVDANENGEIDQNWVSGAADNQERLFGNVGGTDANVHLINPNVVNYFAKGIDVNADNFDEDSFFLGSGFKYDNLYSIYNEYKMEFIDSNYNYSITLHDGATNTSGKMRNIKDEDASIYLQVSSITVEAENTTTGYRSSITSDIIIKMPPLSDTAIIGFSDSELTDYSLVAATGIDTGAGVENGANPGTLGGNVYAGETNDVATTIGHDLTYNGDLFISDGEFNISNGTDINFTLGENAEFWTQDIVVGNDGKFMTNEGSYTYTADDLNLKGTESIVRIDGNYYGFGDSTTDAAQSSSILIQGEDTNLSFGEDSSLVLAGSSFISPLAIDSIASSNADVLMGESVSVITNQRAYYVPYSHIVLDSADDTRASSNPVIQSSTTLPNATLSQEVLWNIDGKDYTFADYGLSANDIKPIVRNLRPTGADGQYAIYYFFDFANVVNANDYFNDYFTVYGNSILGSYIDSMGVSLEEVEDNSHPSYLDYTRGLVTMQYTGSGDYTVLQGLDSNEVSNNDSYRTRYDDLSILPPVTEEVVTALADSISGSSGYVSFYDNTSSLEPKPEVARFYEGDITIDSNVPPAVVAIFATGDVTVSRDFNGFIYSQGSITINASNVNSHNDVIKAFSSESEVEKSEGTYYTFSNLFGSTDSGSGTEEEDTSNILIAPSWDPNDIVVYSDWERQ